jgi:exosortase E/protease (VPEID-CTERM system)
MQPFPRRYADNGGDIPKRDFHLQLSGRFALVAAALFVEKILLGVVVDTELARSAEGLGGFVHAAQHWAFRFMVAFLTTAAVLAYARASQSSKPDVVKRLATRISPRWILVHALLVAALVPLSYFLYRPNATRLAFALISAAWCLAGISAVVAGFFAVAPFRSWLQGISALGVTWLYAAAAALIGTGVWQESERLWSSAAALTFVLVRLVLSPFLTIVRTDAATHIIESRHFAVEITSACSGLEGLGLMFVFCVAWLVYFRREYIFPLALLLIPASLTAIFGLNVLRIAALMLIGNAGYPEVALFGFHSQAGWIAFNIVACAVVYFSRRSAWLNRTMATGKDDTIADNPAATYLMPLLAILAAGIVSHAMSGRFEVMYPLRLVAGLAVLACYRRQLIKIKWAFSWRGPALGLAVFLIWIAAAGALLPVAAMPEPLASFSPISRGVWISTRMLASIFTVPIAEELAYRGYLMRRLTKSDFESVPYESVRWPAITITAIVFGAAHGALWLPGIAAGLAYGLLVTYRGSLGEAVAAHATTNLLIAVAVVAGNQWQLW